MIRWTDYPGYPLAVRCLRLSWWMWQWVTRSSYVLECKRSFLWASDIINFQCVIDLSRELGCSIWLKNTGGHHDEVLTLTFICGTASITYVHGLALLNSWTYHVDRRSEEKWLTKVKPSREMSQLWWQLRRCKRKRWEFGYRNRANTYHPCSR